MAAIDNPTERHADATFPEGGRWDVCTVHTQINISRQTQSANNTGLLLSRPFGCKEKAGVKMSEQEKRSLGWGVLFSLVTGVLDRRPESLPIVHTHDRKQTLPEQSPVRCNICQRNVKMSVNWGYFLHLPFTISHLLSTHPRMWWGSIYTSFYSRASSQQPYAGATRDVSMEQKARITFYSFIFFFLWDRFLKHGWNC